MKREFYVLNYSFNDKKVVNYNIFNNSKLCDGIDNLLNNFVTYKDFVEQLDRLLRYCFWCKAEYEIMVGDLFEQDADRLEKIDIYRQVAPNVEVIAKIAIDYHNERVDNNA